MWLPILVWQLKFYLVPWLFTATFHSISQFYQPIAHTSANAPKEKEHKISWLTTVGFPPPYLSCFDSCLMPYCSVTQSCPTLCSPMDCSMPGFPVLRYLPEFALTHVHWVSDAIQPSHPLSPSSPLALNLWGQVSGSFPMSQFFALGGQSIGASVSP